MAYTRDWDETQPVNHLKVADIPDRIRKVKIDVAERIKNWIYGFISGETQEGLKKAPLVAQSSAPGAESGKGIIYAKEVSGVVELFFKDSNDNEIQITTNGQINVDLSNYVTLDTTQTISGEKTFSVSPNIPDPSESNDAVNKGYMENYVETNATKVKATASDPTAGYLDAKVDNATIGVSGTSLYVKDSSISQVKLKTATGTGSMHIYTDTGGENEAHSAVLPGGEYGFYPTTYYQTNTDDWAWVLLDGVTQNSVYAPRIAFARGGDTKFGARDQYTGDFYIYWKQRYVTASGRDHWIFLLVDNSNKIWQSWIAPDHPSANVSATHEEIPHPFDVKDGYKVVLVDEDILDEVKKRVAGSKGRKTPVEIIMSDFVLDDWVRPKFTPREIIKIDEWDVYEGERVADIKVPQWCRIMFHSDTVCLKRIVIDKLPPGIEYRKMRLK